MSEFNHRPPSKDGVADALDSMRGALNKALRKKQRKRVVREIDDVESKLVDIIETPGGLCEKFTRRRGSPDRLAIEGHGWDRAAHLLRDFLRSSPEHNLLATHAGRKVIVRELVAQMIYFVECKVPGKDPEKKQRADHARRRKLGITVRIYDGDWRE
jgi:hypothetical protein